MYQPPEQEPITVRPEPVYPPPPPNLLPSGLRAAVPPSGYGAPEPPRERVNGCAYGCAGMGGCLLLIGVAVLVLVLTGVTSVGNLIGGIGSALGAGRAPVANVLTTQTVVTSIQPLGQLVSVSAQLAKADIFVGIEAGLANACGFGANHVAQGAVEAGIDLTQLTASDIQYDALRNTYVIALPAPALTSCRVDYIRQYDRTTTACNVDWDEARFLAQYTALIDFRDDAIEGGILTRARSEARDVIANFISLTTGANVEVNFREPTQPVPLPPSCQPDPPQGWVQNASGTWTRR
ncbi:MAG: DUF4230 domain-containing protein [Candidatus Flexifilum sp.]